MDCLGIYVFDHDALVVGQSAQHIFLEVVGDECHLQVTAVPGVGGADPVGDVVGIERGVLPWGSRARLTAPGKGLGVP